MMQGKDGQGEYRYTERFYATAMGRRIPNTDSKTYEGAFERAMGWPTIQIEKEWVKVYG